MRLRRIIDATLGRRVLFRVWLYGVSLIVAVGLCGALFVRYALDPSPLKQVEAVAYAFDEQVLERRQDPGALRAEVTRIRVRAGYQITVFDASNAVLATACDPPPAPMTSTERASVARGGTAATFGPPPGRYLLTAFENGRLAAYAVALPPQLPFAGNALIVVLGPIFLGLALLSIPMARSIVRPLERLADLARDLGAGNLAVHAPDDRRDEIGNLARAFNEMASRLRRLRAAEREILADISHELRTPLARMRVVVELAGKKDPEKVERYLNEISADLSELEQLLEDVLTSTRLDLGGATWQEAQPPLRLRIVAASAIAAAAATRFHERWPARELTSRVEEEGLMIDADPVLLRRALDNLVDNARKYSADEDPIQIVVRRADLAGSPAARIDVIDGGIGIAPEDQGRVFTSFFRADKSRARATGGVGLGLALARRIVEAHGGVVGVESTLDRGSRFWVALPLAQRGAPSGER